MLRRLTNFLGFQVLFALTLTFSASADDNTPNPELHRLGQSLYKLHCAICHGSDGEGDGVLSKEFVPAPRNFTEGVFRFTSTKNGEPPARIDILRVIERGIEGSYGRSMPPFPQFSSSERLALVEVVRQFAEINAYGVPVAIPPRPDVDPERSAALFEELGCSGCHGETGKGDGPLAADLEDMSGQAIRPADLTTGKFKGGNSIEDIWRRVYSGIAGTPMPSFGQSVSLEEVWAVTLMVVAFASN